MAIDMLVFFTLNALIKKKIDYNKYKRKATVIFFARKIRTTEKDVVTEIYFARNQERSYI